MSELDLSKFNCAEEVRNKLAVNKAINRVYPSLSEMPDPLSTADTAAEMDYFLFRHDARRFGLQALGAAKDIIETAAFDIELEKLLNEGEK